MTKRKVKRRIAFILAIAMVFSGGGTGVCAAGKVTLKLKKTKISVKKGKKVTLKVTKKNVKKIKSAKWSTANKTIATVSSKGVVKGIKAGKTTVTCTIKYRKKSSKKVFKKVLKCKVTVIDPSSATNPVEPDDGGVSTEAPEGTKKPSVSTAPAGTNLPLETPQKTDVPSATVAPPAHTEDVQVTGGPVTPVPESPLPQTTVAPGEGIASDDLSLSRGSGTYDSEFELTMTSAAGASIYYTTDGSDPRTSTTRKLYTSGILVKDRKGDENVLSAISPDLFDSMNYEIVGNQINSKCTVPSKEDVDKCSVIRAVSCDENGSMSDVVTNTYFIGRMSEHIDNIAQSVSAAGKNLAVVSITMDQNDLFDYETGIYVKGKCFDDSINEYIQNHGSLDGVNVESDLQGNFNQKKRAWERDCHIEYFESDGTNTTCELQQDCGVRIQGNYSRSNVQKSFRLYAREDYGKKNFKYPFFGDELQDDTGKTMEKFKTLVLRNGGNDAFNYKYKDIFTQSFLHDRAIETLHGRPCVLYLNGEYWGYYVLQDDMTDNFLENKYGVNKDHVVLYKGTDEAQYSSYGYKLDEGEFPEGVTEEDYYLKDTLDYLDREDFSDSSVYQEFMDQYMDEQSALDYFAANIYLNNRYDWPGKNWSIWRTTVTDDTNAYSDNRWRFCMFDLDLTTEPTWVASGGDSWQESQITVLAESWSSNVIKKIFGNLMENAAFRQKLADTITEIGTQNYAVDKVEERAEKYKGMYSPLNDQFQKRFNSNYAVYAIGEANHNANLSFLRQRLSYIPTLISDMNALYPEKTEPVNSTLVWEGSWTRYSSENTTTSQTNGLSIVRDDDNFIRITVSNWKQFTNPVIKVTVADGYSANARFHIWSDDTTKKNEYIYQNETEWIGKEISISDYQGTAFYINANDATLTKFEIYDQK